ncbi:MAG: hypothetical protein K2Y71_12890 [Xanthobacteraceae bacterium]|nr:hypothetical protein [Xanthobacteraceae bacterium]
MSRNLTRILMAVLVLNAVAVGATMLSPNTAHSTANNTVVAAADFDYIFNSVTPTPRPAFMDSVTAAPIAASTPAATEALNFDKVFASVNSAPQLNTPPNRERLRNIGWRRILGS